MFRDMAAFSSFSVNDIEKAFHFYQDLLGLEVIKGDMEVYDLILHSGHRVVMYIKPYHVPATFTILNFEVPDLEASMEQMLKLGIRFEQYGGNLKTDSKGILHGRGAEPDIAWFKDPSGNILSVLQHKVGNVLL